MKFFPPEVLLLPFRCVGRKGLCGLQRTEEGESFFKRFADARTVRGMEAFRVSPGLCPRKMLREWI